MFYTLFCRIFAHKKKICMEYYIEDKLYYKIQDYCEYNSIDLNEYVNDCIVKQFNIDRYGDLNEILDGKKDEKIETPINKFVKLEFNENEKHFIIKQSLDEDVYIPLSDFEQLMVKTTSKIEDNTMLEQKNEIDKKPIITKKKRTLQSK